MDGAVATWQGRTACIRLRAAQPYRK